MKYLSSSNGTISSTLIKFFTLSLFALSSAAIAGDQANPDAQESMAIEVPEVDTDGFDGDADASDAAGNEDVAQGNEPLSLSEQDQTDKNKEEA